MLVPALRQVVFIESCLCPSTDLRRIHMGIGTVTLSCISWPLQALSRWLGPCNQPHQRTRVYCLDSNKSNPRINSFDAAVSTHFLVSATHASNAASPQISALHLPRRKVRCLPPPAAQQLLKGETGDLFAGPLASPAPGGQFATSRPLRVVRSHGRGGSSGKLVISGRMVDVCAELDRLAAKEAAGAVVYG